MDEFNEADFRGLDLNVLLAFMALMRARSVKGAAERLYLGAPAMSMALARLREAFGDALLVRTRQGMQPTPRAFELFAQIEPALAQIHRSVFAPERFDLAQATGVLRLGIGDDLEPFVLPRLSRLLADTAPGLRLANHSCNFRTAPDLVDADVVDLALAPLTDTPRAAQVALPLHEETFVCLYDPAVLQAGKSGRLSKALYLATPHVLRATDGATRTLFDELFEQQGHRRQVAATSATFLAAALALRGNRLLANMPGLAARLLARELGLGVSPLPLAVPHHQLALLCHAKRAGDARTLWFRQALKEIVAALGAEQSP